MIIYCPDCHKHYDAENVSGEYECKCGRVWEEQSKDDYYDAVAKAEREEA